MDNAMDDAVQDTTHEAPNLTLSDAVLEKLRSYLAARRKRKALRLSARQSGLKFYYKMGFAGEEEPGEDDRVLTLDGVTLWMDAESARLMEGTTVELQETLSESGFRYDNPQEAKARESMDETFLKVHDFLEAEVNPSLASHNGFVELDRIADGVAYVRMGGGCQGCSEASATLRYGVKSQLKESIPEVQKVVDVTDHEAGETPYYSCGH